ncbi:MAG: GntR family transcriptional regulator [Kiritimatiellae bacterium]|nr:GntR family transcriptional regulator [Kiritimatiellia bacterium]
MLPEINIKKHADIPVFRQIAGQIASRVQNGLIPPGNQLPSERELAAKLGLARGTIARAYSELARNHVIEILPGSRSIVAGEPEVSRQNRKERALQIIDDLLVELKKLRFSYREIRALIDLSILEKESQFEQLCVAAVDCNPESLSIFQRQLGFIAQIALTRILLDDIFQETHPERRLAAFDLILCTATHYNELAGRCPAVRDKLVQLVVAPTQQSIIDLAGIGMNQQIGVICESRQFLNIIIRRLNDFSIPAGRVHHLAPEETGKLPGFLAAHQVIITPPGYTFPITRDNTAAIQAFTHSGGRIIPFDYQIERSSLLYVEERIKDLIRRR